MATVPVPNEGSSEEPQPGRSDPTPRAASDASSGDPWARSGNDPWADGRRREVPVRAPVLEEEFLQFLQWRQAQPNQAYGMGHQHGGAGAAGQGLWHFARDEHERTTAGPPPEWDGVSTEFKDYKIKARIWLRTTRTPAHARGPLLLKSLTKGPWEDLKFLANDDEWMADPDNGNKLITMMDSKEFYGEEKRESMLAACARLTYHLRRQRGETARAFMTRWDTAERKIREHDVRLPQEYLGFLIVNALQLDSEKTKLLLNYTKGSLQVADVKSWLRVHETDLDMNHLGSDRKKASVNYLADPEDTKEIQLVDLDDEDDMMENDQTDILLTTMADLEEPKNNSTDDMVTLTESETKDILMTMLKDAKHRGRNYAGALKAKKNRDLARGYGAGRDGLMKPGTYEVSISELKKRTKCNACGAVGHWARECPKPKTDSFKPKSKEVNFLMQDQSSFAESEFFYLEDDVAAGSKESVHDCHDFSQSDRAYMACPAAIQCFHMTTMIEDDGCATIDTGCQRMAIGLNTLNKLMNFQPPELPITFCDEVHQFRSVHKVSCTTQLACIPCSLGVRGSILRPALFEEEHCADAPFLLSLPFLLHCRAILHLDEDKGLSLVSQRFGFKVSCHLGPTGALRIPIQQFTDSMKKFLSTKVSKKRDEYELMQTMTEKINHRSMSCTTQSSGSEGGSRKSPALGAAPRSNCSDAWSAAEAGSQRWRHASGGDSGLGPNDLESHHDHQPSHSTSSSTPSSNSWAKRSSCQADDRDGGLVGDCPFGAGGGPTEPSSSSEVVGRELFTVSNAIGMVSSDFAQGLSPQEVPIESTGTNDTKVINFEANNGGTRSTPCQHVGDPAGLGCESRGPSMSLPARSPSVDFEDGEQSRPPVLAMRQGTIPAVQFLPVADLSTTSRRLEPELQHRVLHQETAGDLPTYEARSPRHQWTQEQGEMHGLRQVAGRREDSTGAHGSTRTSEPQGSNDTALSEFHRRPEQVEAGEQGVPGVFAVASGPTATDGEPDQRFPRSVKSTRPVHVMETEAEPVKPGLRRHIFGCLKRAETSWLELHRLICETSENHLESTCKLIRESLQLQQPHMKHMADLYLLQPKQLKTVAEVCNPGRFGPQTDFYGLRAGQAFDLELGWNLLQSSEQEKVLNYIRTERPGLTVISPPCVKFSMLLNLSLPKWTENPERFDQHIRELRDAKKLLKFCVKVCQLCRSLGLSFLFEHPWSASSWNEPCLQQLVSATDCHLARGDQCMFGLVTNDGEPMRKRSGFLTNNFQIAQQLNQTCDQSHTHQHVMGRDRGASINRSRLAQKYPIKLVSAILIAFANSIGISSDLLYIVDGQKTLEWEQHLEQNLLLSEENLMNQARDSVDPDPDRAPRAGHNEPRHPCVCLDDPSEVHAVQCRVPCW